MPAGDLGYDWTANGFDLTVDATWDAASQVQVLDADTSLLRSNSAAFSTTSQGTRTGFSSTIRDWIVDAVTDKFKNYSVTAWWQPTESTPNNSATAVSFHRDANDPSFWRGYCTFRGTGAHDVHSQYGSPTFPLNENLGSSPTNDAWNLLGYTISANGTNVVLKGYINGTLGAGSTKSDNTGTTHHDIQFRLGNPFTLTNRLQTQGYTAQLCIWNKTLSSGELSSLYNSGSGRKIGEAELSDMFACYLFHSNADYFGAAGGITPRPRSGGGFRSGGFGGGGFRKDINCGLVDPTDREVIEINSWRY